MTLRKPRGKRNVASYREQAIQIAVVEYLALALPEDAVVWSTRNEAKRTPVELAFAIRAGLLPGMTDLCIFLWRQLYVIEMKETKPTYFDGREPNKHERDQISVQNRLRKNGAHVGVCWTVDMAERFLRNHDCPLRATVLPSGAVQKEIAE